MRHGGLSVLVSFVAGSVACQVHPADAQSPGHAWVILGTDTIVAEVAETPEEQARGLMGREHLEDGTGMLFVFRDEAIRSFWMRGTLIPLDIAFLDARFTIVDIQSMEPRSERTHASARPAMYALEVSAGTFAKLGIGVGTQVEVVFPPAVRRRAARARPGREARPPPTWPADGRDVIVLLSPPDPRR